MCFILPPPPPQTAEELRKQPPRPEKKTLPRKDPKYFPNMGPTSSAASAASVPTSKKIFIFDEGELHTEPLLRGRGRPAGVFVDISAEAEPEEEAFCLSATRANFDVSSFVSTKPHHHHHHPAAHPPRTCFALCFFFFAGLKVGWWGKKWRGKLPTRTTYFIHNLFFCAL